MNARAYPFLRLLVPFLLGLATGAATDRPLPSLGYWLAGGAIAAIVFAFQAVAYRIRWMFGAYLFVWLFAAGYFHLTEHNELRRADHFSAAGTLPCVVEGQVYEAPSRGARLKVPLHVERAGMATDSMQACSGNVLLFFPLDSSYAPAYGARLRVRVRLQATQGPANPYAFDYGRYLHFQNIHYQAFVTADSAQVLAEGGGSALWRWAYESRDRLLTVLHRYFPDQAEYAVASALLVGYKDELTDELQTAYAETGSMHALAVSGTHVGLLYMGLMAVFQRIPWRGRTRRWAETLFTLVAIWAFTFVTGGTASVLRASVMFTAFLIGKMLHRDASAWNILAGSALVLLLVNPYFLLDAGFQLSYAAVAGMVYFYPRFYRMTPVLPKWADSAVQVLVVGFAAQLGTLPLSLYYFHQFPVYFWLAGWVVVLGGAIFLWGGALLVLLDAFLPAVSVWLGKALYGLVWGMNALVVWISRLPGSVIGGLWFDGVGVFLLCVLVVLFGVLLAFRNGKIAIALLSVALLLGCYRLPEQIRLLDQQDIFVYSVSKKSLLDFFDGGRAYTLGDTSLTLKQVRFAAQNNRWARGIRTVLPLSDTAVVETANLYYAPPFLQFFQHRLLIAGDSLPLPPHPVRVDALVLRGRSSWDPAACITQFSCKMVIIDLSVPPKTMRRWKKACTAAGVACWDVRESGCFQLSADK